MFLAIEGVLNGAEAQVLREAAAGLAFRDGAATAGPMAGTVKDNAQAAPGPELDAILAKVEVALRGNDLFTVAARPRALAGLLLSRYRPGQSYGAHVDDALMAAGRADVSFTLFLSPPEDYDGGALVIEDGLEARAVRLGAGDLLLYPATTLHRVEPVTRGERLAVVGWAESLIRDAGRRELLFDLERVLRHLHDSEGKSEAVDLLARSRSNLLRMWAET